MSGLGMHVFFPSFIIEVDTSTDCHLLYEPIGRAACLADLDYVQPKYLVDKSASSSALGYRAVYSSPRYHRTGQGQHSG
jgi:hypothetical protein